MAILDQSQFNNSEFQAYFHESVLSHDAGYSDYELEFVFQQGEHFKNNIIDFFSNESINGAIDVLELGGARGHRAKFGLETFGLKSWEIIDLYDSPLKQTHNKLTYTIGDARTLLADTNAYRDDKKDILFSCRFLDCIPEVSLPDLISNMNRVTKQGQYHVITKDANPNFYSTRDLTWWSQQGFASGTVLIYSHDFKAGNFDDIIRVA